MGRVPKREQEGKTTAPWHKEECRICGEERKEEQMLRHRLIPKRFGGSDDEKNVVNVCANCHRTLRKVYDNRFWSRVETNYQLDSFDFSTESEKQSGAEKNEQSCSEISSKTISGNTDAPWNNTTEE